MTVPPSTTWPDESADADRESPTAAPLEARRDAVSQGPRERRCPGVNLDGSPCRVPAALLLASGWCFEHSPDHEQQRRAGKALGGLRTGRRTRPPGLDPNELPPLDSHENAEKWAATIAEAVATGRLSSAQGSTALRAVAEWRACHDAGRLVQRLAALEAKLNGRGGGGR